MTSYNGMHAVPSSRKPFWTKKKFVVGGVAAAVLVPSAAWAAVTLFGFGDYTASAGVSTNLAVLGTPTFTKTLAPGETVGLKVSVKNPNTFPVKVTDLIAKKSASSIIPPIGKTVAACAMSAATGSATVDFPAEGLSAGITDGGTEFAAGGGGTIIPPGDTTEITFPAVVTQASTATALCGVSGHYAIKGQAGS